MYYEYYEDDDVENDDEYLEKDDDEVEDDYDRRKLDREMTNDNDISTVECVEKFSVFSPESSSSFPTHQIC